MMNVAADASSLRLRSHFADRSIVSSSPEAMVFASRKFPQAEEWRAAPEWGLWQPHCRTPCSRGVPLSKGIAQSSPAADDERSSLTVPLESRARGSTLTQTG